MSRAVVNLTHLQTALYSRFDIHVALRSPVPCYVHNPSLQEHLTSNSPFQSSRLLYSHNSSAFHHPDHPSQLLSLLSIPSLLTLPQTFDNILLRALDLLQKLIPTLLIILE